MAKRRLNRDLAMSLWGMAASPFWDVSVLEAIIETHEIGAKWR